MNLNSVIASLVIADSIKNPQGSSEVTEKETESTYIVELIMAVVALGLPYLLIALTPFSVEPYEKILSLIAAPLVWEFPYMTEDSMLKWLVIGAGVSMMAVPVIKTLATITERALLKMQSPNKFILSIGHGVFMLTLLIKWWCRLLIPLIAIKLLVFGGLLAVITIIQ